MKDDVKFETIKDVKKQHKPFSEEWLEGAMFGVYACVLVLLIAMVMSI